MYICKLCPFVHSFVFCQLLWFLFEPGFSEGGLLYENTHPSPISDCNGTLPDGIYDNNTRMEFCCRNDGGVNEPIILPTSSPFVLYKRADTSDCQRVKGLYYHLFTTCKE